MDQDRNRTGRLDTSVDREPGLDTPLGDGRDDDEKVAAGGIGVVGGAALGAAVGGPVGTVAGAALGAVGGAAAGGAAEEVVDGSDADRRPRGTDDLTRGR